MYLSINIDFFRALIFSKAFRITQLIYDDIFLNIHFVYNMNMVTQKIVSILQKKLFLHYNSLTHPHLQHNITINYCGPRYLYRIFEFMQLTSPSCFCTYHKQIPYLDFNITTDKQICWRRLRFIFIVQIGKKQKCNQKSNKKITFFLITNNTQIKQMTFFIITIIKKIQKTFYDFIFIKQHFSVSDNRQFIWPINLLL